MTKTTIRQCLICHITLRLLRKAVWLVSVWNRSMPQTVMPATMAELNIFSRTILRDSLSSTSILAGYRLQDQCLGWVLFCFQEVIEDLCTICMFVCFTGKMAAWTVKCSKRLSFYQSLLVFVHTHSADTFFLTFKNQLKTELFKSCYF